MVGKLEAIMLWDRSLNNVAKLGTTSGTLLFLCRAGSIVAYGCSLMDLQHGYVILVDEVCAILWPVVHLLRIIELDYLVGA